jgi:hypothetical protein
MESQKNQLKMQSQKESIANSRPTAHLQNPNKQLFCPLPCLFKCACEYVSKKSVLFKADKMSQSRGVLKFRVQFPLGIISGGSDDIFQISSCADVLSPNKNSAADFRDLLALQPYSSDVYCKAINDFSFKANNRVFHSKI